MIPEAAWLAVLLVGLVAFVKLGTVVTILGRGLDGRGLPGPLLAAAIALLGAIFFAQPVASAADPSGVARQTLEKQSSETARTTFAQLVAVSAPAPDNKPAPNKPAPDKLAPAPDNKPAPPAPLALRVLAIAAVTTQLGSAFQIGFLLLLPFLLLEVLAGAVITATGASSLRASTAALPFKLLLFVSVDGWTLLMKSLL